MERFQKLLEDRHSYAREWKSRTGGRVLGYFCHYFPEEIAYAAGVLPVRILGQPDTEGISQRYIYGGSFCSYCWNLLAAGLKGDYDYLDGLAHSQCCESINGSYSSWRLHVPVGYDYFVAMPSYIDGPGTALYLRSEMSACRDSMEEWTRKKITDETLDNAIEVYNTSRNLMRQVYQYRRSQDPVVSGAEAFEMVLSSQIMDKEEHNKLLIDALNKLPGRSKSYTGPRLMLIGSEINDTGLVRFIESMGATIVIDRLCGGSSYIWNNVIPNEDRLLALSYAYLDKPRCPVKDEAYRHRINDIMTLAIDYNVQGMVYNIHRFCTPHQQDRPPLFKAFQNKLIPVHEIEYDGTIPMQEFKFRIETFVDTLKK